MATRQRFSNSDDKAGLKPLLSSFAEHKHEPPHATDTVRSFLASFLSMSCAGAERFAVVERSATLIQ
jgi:hypothetical protein